MRKKIFKILLCLFMVVTMFPTLKQNVDAQDENLVTITVNYMFKDGKEAYKSSVSTVLNGTENYPLNIVFPKIAGYKSTFKIDENTYLDKEGINEVINKVEGNIVYNVYYLPIDVQYQVRYYKQNIYNDEYSEDATMYVLSNGLTGAPPSDEYLNRTVEGFTKLYHEPDSIAADGSTIFEIYYDRNYYMINFDLDGGYGTVPFYERYEANVTVAIPTKPGYVFMGWDLHEPNKTDGSYIDGYDGKVNDLPEKLPAHNMKYKALWRPKKIGEEGYTNHYTVVYWKWNPNTSTTDKPVYEYWGSDVINDIEAGTIVNSVKNASEVEVNKVIGLPQYKFYEQEPEKFDKGTIVKGDGTTVVNVYYKPQKYTFKFYYARYNSANPDYKFEVGGSTTYFAEDNTQYSYEFREERLNAILTHDNVDWGKVKTQPIVNDPNGYYNFDSEDIKNYKYYYFTFDAYFGEEIGKKWPVGNIPPVEHASGHTNYGDIAAFSAWNVEFYSKYARNNNKTLKGKYLYVDEGVLYDTAYYDSWSQKTVDLSKFYYNNTVHFLGFYENAVTTVSWNRAIEIHYYMYVPDPNGIYEHNGVKYRLYDDIIIYDNNGPNTVLENQTPTSINGYVFKKNNKNFETSDEKWSNGNTTSYSVHFYYDYAEYRLELNNNGSSIIRVGGENGTIRYTEELSIFGTPSYPTNLEDGVYEFKGWYSDPEFSEDSRVTNDFTMPAHDLMLYAKWEKIKRNVTVFKDREDHDKNVNGTLYEKAFTHGSAVKKDLFTEPTKPGYTFVGWYYDDPITGAKKRFEYEILPFYNDLKLYAEWTSDNVVSYEISYKIFETDTVIADPTKGKTNAGLTKTFDAKSGNELYANYVRGYYPVTNSHSLLMKTYADGESNPNVFTFEYKSIPSVTYKIVYKDATTGVELLTISKDDNGNPLRSDEPAITVKFQQPFDDKVYIPDAMFKTLILSATESQNVITFYCTEVFNEAKYVVEHYIEDTVDGDTINYKLHKTDEFIETLGELVKAEKIAIVGYEHDSSVKPNEAQGTVTKDGLVLKLYYKKKIYPYIVQHMIEGTSTLMPVENNQQPIENFTGKYLDVIEHTAHMYQNYQPIKDKLNIEIRVSEGDPVTNILTFYYTSKHAVVNYVAVTDDGGVGGWLSTNQTVLNATNMQSNIGSTANVNQFYGFAGWYSDPQCTQKVESTPGKVAIVGEKSETIIPKKIENVTYYAKFVRLPGSLTITRTYAEDPRQVYVYEVTNIDDQTQTYTVTLTGDIEHSKNSVTITGLPYGNYKITQQNDWSWRHDDTEITVVHENPSTPVSFNSGINADRTKWLNGNSEIKHNVRG